MKTVASLLAVTGLCLTLSGCYSPSGGIMPFSGGALTYASTESTQKTVTVVDVRTGEEIFKMDIPAGKQLVLDFDADEGDDNVYTPDRMRYEMMDRGDKTGKLGNSMTVPNAASRRVDVTLRRGTEYTPASAMRPLRTDEVADRPSWWTAEGGPMPENKTVEMYDN